MISIFTIILALGNIIITIVAVIMLLLVFIYRRKFKKQHTLLFELNKDVTAVALLNVNGQAIFKPIFYDPETNAYKITIGGEEVYYMKNLPQPTLFYKGKPLFLITVDSAVMLDIKDAKMIELLDKYYSSTIFSLYIDLKQNLAELDAIINDEEALTNMDEEEKEKLFEEYKKTEELITKIEKEYSIVVRDDTEVVVIDRKNVLPDKKKMLILDFVDISRIYNYISIASPAEVKTTAERIGIRLAKKLMESQDRIIKWVIVILGVVGFIILMYLAVTKLAPLLFGTAGKMVPNVRV